MSTSEQSTGDLNIEDIASGYTFSQNIENLEGLTSLHADEQVLIVSVFFNAPIPQVRGRYGDVHT